MNHFPYGYEDQLIKNLSKKLPIHRHPLEVRIILFASTLNQNDLLTSQQNQLIFVTCIRDINQSYHRTAKNSVR